MRWAILLVCGCNQIFGIDRTVSLDAATADAASPPKCPDIGTAPTFSGELRQLQTKRCYAYVPSDTRALATCLLPNFLSELRSGPVDGELAPATINSIDPITPRLAPEGDFFVAIGPPTATGLPTMAEYALVGDTWTLQRTTQVNGMDFSTPSRGPKRRVIYLDFDPIMQVPTNALVELEQTSTGWVFKNSVSYDKITPTTYWIQSLSLSADGLRLLFINQIDMQPTGLGDPPMLEGGPTVFYADRVSLDVPFEKFQPLTAVPTGVDWPYLTQDCGKIYFAALDTVFYLKQ
jgi:hypothetical protein